MGHLLNRFKLKCFLVFFAGVAAGVILSSVYSVSIEGTCLEYDEYDCDKPIGVIKKLCATDSLVRRGLMEKASDESKLKSLLLMSNSSGCEKMRLPDVK
jgi:hypothetical protein